MKSTRSCMNYLLKQDDAGPVRDSILEQARIELGLKSFLSNTKL